MKNLLTHKYSPWLMTILFGLAVFLFWRVRYPFALTYQEQFQMFLFDSDYFAERMAEPGQDMWRSFWCSSITVPPSEP